MQINELFANWLRQIFIHFYKFETLFTRQNKKRMKKFWSNRNNSARDKRKEKKNN